MAWTVAEEGEEGKKVSGSSTQGRRKAQAHKQQPQQPSSKKAKKRKLDDLGEDEFDLSSKKIRNWRKVDVGNKFASMEGFVGLEELDGDADILTLDSLKKPKKGEQVSEKQGKKGGKKGGEEIQEDSPKESKRKEKLKEKKQQKKEQKKANQKVKEATQETEEQAEGEKEGEEEEEEEEEEDDGQEAEQKPKKEKVKVITIPDNLPDIDMSNWNPYGLHSKLMLGLQALGFQQPTAIQAECLPQAITQKKDIIGSAETGSGKTLAFGLPILDYIAKREDYFPRSSLPKEKRKLTALVLAPTRELAIQVKDHLTAASRFIDCWVTPIVGGISTEKQLRLLSHCPDIVVATPGRFWELLTNGGDYLRDFSELKFLVLDEADRMVEEGHFKELDDIMQAVRKGNFGEADNDADFLATLLPEEGEEEIEKMIQKEEKKKKKHRVQTFLFSATLSLGEAFKKQVKGKKKFKQSGTFDALVNLIEFAEPGPSHVNVSRKEILAENIKESRVFCPMEDKDAYLYYFVSRFHGRTIVFVNSIDAIRRLLSVMVLLEIPCGGLHAQMQQRQRLKNLEKLKSSNHFILVATDVAARGLDIPDVEHVIHFQIPRSPDLYVHRAGRTARGANKDGLSILLVAPDEMEPYKKICKVLGKEQGIKEFPIEMAFFPNIKKRTKLAAKIDKEEHLVKKRVKNDDWFEKNAREMEIELDDEFKRKQESPQETASKQRIEAWKQELKRLLKTPLTPMGVSSKYITSSALRDLPESFRETERKGLKIVPLSKNLKAVDALKNK